MQTRGGARAVGEAFVATGQRVDTSVGMHAADPVAVAAFGHVHQAGGIERHAEGIVEAHLRARPIDMAAHAVAGDRVDARGLGER